MALSFDHPNHGVQGVIEKVRVNLGLQRVELALSLLLLFAHYVPHEELNLLHIGAQGASEMAHLGAAADIDLGLLPELQFPYGLVEQHQGL